METKKIPSPEFKITTVSQNSITLEKLKGKKVVILFFEKPYTPKIEELIKKLDEIASQNKNTAVICVDTNDADFPILNQYRKDMRLKNIILTADSYLYKKFNDTLKLEKLPATVFIDGNGFIKFYSKDIGKTDIKKFEKRIKEILKKL